MTREDGFIASFLLLRNLWETLDDDDPNLEELGSVCSEMNPVLMPGFVPADTASFWMWKDAMQNRGLAPRPGVSIDEIQAFDILLELLAIYQSEGFALQPIIKELHDLRLNRGRLTWDHWLSAVELAVKQGVSYDEDTW